MKTIITESMPKKDGERKSRMYLAHIGDEGKITKLTFTQWKLTFEPNDASEYIRDCFTTALIRQVDRFPLKVDYVKYCRDNSPSFTQKVEWLLKNGGCLYTKRGLTY
jgi:hypothetical protein